MVSEESAQPRVTYRAGTRPGDKGLNGVSTVAPDPTLPTAALAAEPVHADTAWLAKSTRDYRPASYPMTCRINASRKARRAHAIALAEVSACRVQGFGRWAQRSLGRTQETVMVSDSGWWGGRTLGLGFVREGERGRRCRLQKPGRTCQ